MDRSSPSSARFGSPTRLAALLIAACSSRAEVETAKPSTSGESGGRGNVDGSGSEGGDDSSGEAGAPHGGRHDSGMGGASDIDSAAGQTSEAPDGGPTQACEGFEFERVTLDDSFTGEAKALADLDGDGLLDVAVGGELLKWYEAPGWDAHEIAVADVAFIGHMQAGDIDADGAIDLVVPDGDLIYWFENPSKKDANAVWSRHLVGNQNFWAHELELADLDSNGKLDVVTNPNLRLWLQGATPLDWQKVELHALADAEGLAVGLIDGDARPDLAVRGHWIRTPGDPSVVEDYQRFEIDDAIHDSVVIKIADVDEDGAPDVAYAPKEDNISEIAWYSADDPEGSWTRHVVGPAGWAHEFAVVDFDGRGGMDFVFAEMSPSPTRRVGAFLQQADGTFTLEVLATSGSHNIVVGDIGNDCDLDIAGSNWEAPPVEIFESRRCDGAPRACP